MIGRDVKEIRSQAGMSQAEFSQQFRINLFTLRQWERKDTRLDSASEAYLTCIQAGSDTVLTLLGTGKKKSKGN